MTEIIVYTQDDCPPCKIVKMFLNEHKVAFQEKNITTNSKARDELINTYNAYSTPTVIVGEEVIVGFDLERLEKAINNNYVSE
jgi:glutaredoxin-like YruB-family protein